MKTHRFLMADGPYAKIDVVWPLVSGYPVELAVAAIDTVEHAASETRGCSGVLVTTNPLPGDIIDAFAPSVRVIGRAGVGLDAIDLKAAEARGITVFHTPDYCVTEVATHAIAMILAMQRRLLEGDSVAREQWSQWGRLTPVEPLEERTAGVIGFGRIGRAVATRLKPFVREVLFYDPDVPSADGFSAVDTLEALLGRSDIVTLHIPATPGEGPAIGERELALMKTDAYLVNVSRGALIDEEALAVALQSGRLRGAALDVLVHEPPVKGHPLLAAPNVLLSPHFAWYSTAAERRVWPMTVEGMIACLEGRTPTSGRVAVVSPVPRPPHHS
jgi:D-3-phosphoglycerate dehydrogenase / 2-oxoglutarate reductase